MLPLGRPVTVFVASSQDKASLTLAKTVVEVGNFRETGVELFGRPVYQKESYLLATFDSLIVSPPDLDALFNPRAYVFLSRHSAESGIPSLTAHTTGNFTDEAKFGGRPKELGMVDPDLLKNYMLSLSRYGNRAHSYRMTIEATHHGPTSLRKPVLFVEIGSKEENWIDRKAAEVVANALLDSLEEGKIWEKAAVAFGGTHYPEKFNKLILESDLALSHVVPKHVLGSIDVEMLGQMLRKTNRPVGQAVLDWKGLGSHKERILSLIKQFGLEMIRL